MMRWGIRIRANMFIVIAKLSFNFTFLQIYYLVTGGGMFQLNLNFSSATSITGRSSKGIENLKQNYSVLHEIELYWKCETLWFCAVVHFLLPTQFWDKVVFCLRSGAVVCCPCCPLVFPWRLLNRSITKTIADTRIPDDHTNRAGIILELIELTLHNNVFWSCRN